VFIDLKKKFNYSNQYESLSLAKHQSANGITRATLACFLTIFVIAFGETFLDYFWNIFEKVF
jgi:hypothetical protein